MSFLYDIRDTRKMSTIHEIMEGQISTTVFRVAKAIQKYFLLDKFDLSEWQTTEGLAGIGHTQLEIVARIAMAVVFLYVVVNVVVPTVFAICKWTVTSMSLALLVILISRLVELVHSWIDAGELRQASPNSGT